MLNLAALFRAACEAELAALKPGNVHVHAEGHGMTVAQFRASAAAAAGPLCRPGAALGARILAAVQATRAAVGLNTNLGIVLLCAPLAMAAEMGGALRPALARVIAEAGVADTAACFQAIRLAAPAGLGEAAEHDVRAPATVALADAMASAAGRDVIARHYATDFADLFDAALPAYAAALRDRGEARWAIVDLYLFWMQLHPDTHVARKHGAARAAALQRSARAARELLRARPAWCDAAPALLAWDAALKAEGVNPGTSADLTVATIYAASIETALRAGGVGG